MTVGSKLILAYYWSGVEKTGVLNGWKFPSGASKKLEVCLLGVAWGLISNLTGENFLFLEFLHFSRKCHSDVSKMRT